MNVLIIYITQYQWNYSLIKNNPSITQKEIAKTLDITRDGVKYNMNVLKELGIAIREGSTKKGSWKILK